MAVTGVVFVSTIVLVVSCDFCFLSKFLIVFLGVCAYSLGLFFWFWPWWVGVMLYVMYVFGVVLMFMFYLMPAGNSRACSSPLPPTLLGLKEAPPCPTRLKLSPPTSQRLSPPPQTSLTPPPTPSSTTSCPTWSDLQIFLSSSSSSMI